jgi:hypothetical protein
MRARIMLAMQGLELASTSMAAAFFPTRSQRVFLSLIQAS